MTEVGYVPDKGDLIWLVLDPRTGHEQSGHRPALVLSPKFFNQRTGLAVVCPVTTKIKGLPFEVLLEQTDIKGAVLPIHVRSIDIKARKASFIEKVPIGVIESVTEKVRAIIL
jgi:mRNA interferase MazF